MSRAITPEQMMAYDQARATALESSACLLAAFKVIGVPRTMLDVGCGDGHLVKIAAALGTQRATGLDIAVSTVVGGDGYALINVDIEGHDFSLMYGGAMDLVLCLEVAEHLSPNAADPLCATLAGALAQDGILLFSAATPGQGGSGHVNEQPHDYWVSRLSARGLTLDRTLTSKLSVAWRVAAPAAWWYAKNLLVFRKQAVWR